MVCGTAVCSLAAFVLNRRHSNNECWASAGEGVLSACLLFSSNQHVDVRHHGYEWRPLLAVVYMYSSRSFFQKVKVNRERLAADEAR